MYQMQHRQASKSNTSEGFIVLNIISKLLAYVLWLLAAVTVLYAIYVSYSISTNGFINAFL